MKDLDFDELDRAVNTLMGSVPKTDTPGTEPETKTVSITPTLPPESSASSKPAPSSMPVPSPSPVNTSTTPSLATRRGGRFMDVVHSSSDMKKDKPASPVSRQGVTIAPTKPVVPEEPKPASVMPTAEPSVPPSAPVEEPAPTTDVHAVSQSDWPDPLEMSGFNKTEEKKPEVDSTPEPSTSPEEPNETPAVNSNSDELEPLSSPFLSDAKVEKRPLGGNTPVPSLEDEAPEPDHTPVVMNADASGTVDNPNDQLPPSTEDTKKELPPEYQGDLVAIESGSTETPAPTVAESTDTQKSERAQEAKPAAHPTALLEAKTEDDHAPVGPTSIAQQYKEEPSTGDQHNGAIYDTEAYHKPLAHPAKKKSGWMVIVWILIILLVGAGAGAALYFLGIF